MSETNETAGAAAPIPRRRRTPTARLAARQAKRARDLRIVEMLARGASVKAIAAEEKLTTRRTRVLVNEALARRGMEPASGFAQLQVRRLAQALDHAVEAMGYGNIQAIDRVIKIVRELDRYEAAFVQPRAEGIAQTELGGAVKP
jgi:DNA-binding NarL/FixJ family response regulator